MCHVSQLYTHLRHCVACVLCCVCHKFTHKETLPMCPVLHVSQLYTHLTHTALGVGVSLCVVVCRTVGTIWSQRADVLLRAIQIQPGYSLPAAIHRTVTANCTHIGNIMYEHARKVKTSGTKYSGYPRLIMSFLFLCAKKAMKWSNLTSKSTFFCISL